MWSLVLFGVILFKLNMKTHAELYTATEDLSLLLETHSKVIEHLDLYMGKEDKKLSAITRILDNMVKEYTRASEDISKYLSSPINVFILTKMITTDLRVIKFNIRAEKEYKSKLKLNYTEAQYPSLDDLIGAAHGLARLQGTYNLDVLDISEGKLNGVAYSTPMTTSDCFKLSQALINNQIDVFNARVWMIEALRKYKIENVSYRFTSIDIMDNISYACHLLGDSKGALEWTNKILALDPNHTQARINLSLYQKRVNKADVGTEKTEPQRDGEEPRRVKVLSVIMKIYEQLCRGETNLPKEMSNRLTCRYMTETHPFLKIAPIKMEMVYFNPGVVLFHDVLSDAEIDTIKQMSKPRLKRAAVNNPINGDPAIVHYRISKYAWLYDKESDIIARISRRVVQLTGLDIETAEPLQISHYGIAGHYEPHFDFSRKWENVTFDGGNRIATVMFYMSNVAEGGATVFPILGQSVFPVKGAALFWLNLHPSGDGDYFTLHAGCPVLRGSKWVSNKWLHLGGQEFRRPCNLAQQENTYRFVPDFLSDI